MTQAQYLTPEGAKNLERRLMQLIEIRRPQVAERLRLALEEGGDLMENTEYEEAKNEQAFIEGEISRLEYILRTAHILDEDEQHDSVVPGARVTLVEKGTDEEEIYHLVGSAEANPSQGKISIESPLGRALLGAKVGDRIKVQAPDGEITFKVEAIQ
jgi:transcription elongation factor GreA